MKRGIARIPLFQGWPAARRKELEAGSRLIYLTEGETLIRQGQVLDGLYAVVEGAVEVASSQPDGRWYTRRLGLPGMISGFLSTFDRKGSPYFYIALEPTTILFVHRPLFVEMLRKQPALWMSVVEEMMKVQRLTLAAIEEQIFLPLRIRIVRTLVYLAGEHGVRDEHDALRVRLTQDKLASLLGVTRQSVSKELKRLMQEGLIAVEYGGIRVDVERLRGILAEASGPGSTR